MEVNIAGLQAEMSALQTKLSTLETVIPGLTEDYQSLLSRIEALEAALAQNDPAAIQAALYAWKNQATALNARLEQANTALGTLDASVPPPPAPPGT